MSVLPSAKLALHPPPSRCLSSSTTSKSLSQHIHHAESPSRLKTSPQHEPERKMGSRATFVQLCVRRAKSASAPAFMAVALSLMFIFVFSILLRMLPLSPGSAMDILKSALNALSPGVAGPYEGDANALVEMVNQVHSRMTQLRLPPACTARCLCIHSPHAHSPPSLLPHPPAERGGQLAQPRGERGVRRSDP